MAREGRDGVAQPWLPHQQSRETAEIQSGRSPRSRIPLRVQPNRQPAIAVQVHQPAAPPANCSSRGSRSRSQSDGSSSSWDCETAPRRSSTPTSMASSLVAELTRGAAPPAVPGAAGRPRAAPAAPGRRPPWRAAGRPVRDCGPGSSLQVGGDDAALHRAVDAVAGAVAAPVTAASGRASAPSTVPPRWFSNPVSGWVSPPTSGSRRPRRWSAWAAATSSRRAARPRRRAPPPRSRTSGRAPGWPRRSPAPARLVGRLLQAGIADQVLGGQPLRVVLGAAERVEVQLSRHRVGQRDLDDLRVETPQPQAAVAAPPSCRRRRRCPSRRAAPARSAPSTRRRSLQHPVQLQERRVVRDHLDVAGRTRRDGVARCRAPACARRRHSPAAPRGRCPAHRPPPPGVLEMLEPHVPQPGQVLAVGHLPVDRDHHARAVRVHHRQRLLPACRILRQQHSRGVRTELHGPVAAGDLVHQRHRRHRGGGVGAQA